MNWRRPGFSQKDSHPVLCISWNDAVAYCRWLSIKEGRPYRLPTEAEWEYAARAGTQTMYYWGEDPDAGKGNLNASDLTAKAKYPTWLAFNFNDGFLNTAPVASFAPNSWGLHDMLGNANEWVADYYAPLPGRKETDPKGPAQPPGSERRVMRGGSWNSFPLHTRLAYRFNFDPSLRFDFTGFRVAMDAAPVR